MNKKAIKWNATRLSLPYGKWTCADGSEVLFNRNYSPIWARLPNGSVIPIDPDTWIDWETQEWFYGDATRPQENRQSYKDCMEILREWGVANSSPRIIEIFNQGLKAGTLHEGNVYGLGREWATSKRFPPVVALLDDR